MLSEIQSLFEAVFKQFENIFKRCNGLCQFSQLRMFTDIY